ncbi:MOSC N-terminal beta barrel domain-containing protein [Sodiomyces alkalinus F11]|uniref:Molybdenum cofactor sulfurase n=1 Tax=Sodiomyces alkalinus (strain CBS 110278 / VKM F-3762 / F11) TaxID=1314773 RepID=A0A3N2PSD7_SODAK|nr:MOSC N-terminal beta barrel domain-containing protein [Sodiomyces alkalinus F11]ROT37398.1 MOSC N-terminal beta barrel domain-containing protein [Sodiomyces alkalinus F11]
MRLKMEDNSAGYNSRVEELRSREFPMLKDSVYLDHAGTTLYSKSLVERVSADMMSNLWGNPHSGSSPSQYTTARIEDIRVRLLHFFNADPANFDLVFVANATAGVKLILEAFRCRRDGFSYVYHQACHTSLVGVREEAKESACVDNAAVHAWIQGKNPFKAHPRIGSAVLFSYSAQSHLDGTRYPLSWSHDLRRATKASSLPLYTLLDAASLAATSPLDLGNAESAPDFTVVSLYKIFGYPDLGALIVRKQAEGAFQSRRYFGGGTVDTVLCGKEQWHAPKSQYLHERLEDGTLPFHSILALDAALEVHQELFGSMDRISSYTAHLSRRMFRGLAGLKHANGEPVCVLYSAQTGDGDGPHPGPVVSFNIRNASGAWVSLAEFEKLAALKNFHVRTGGVCSPGGVVAALGLHPWEVRRNFSSGFRCGTDQDIIAGKPTGVIRVSLGAMSIVSDVDRFISFIEEFYREEEPSITLPAVSRCPEFVRFEVQQIMVYPIKSCAGYAVPPGVPWEVKPEGLAWDREWCLVHEGTGQALSQKRYPKMALIRPFLDFDNGVLRLKYCGQKHTDILDEISVPLSANLWIIDSDLAIRPSSSRVCGDEIAAQNCTVPEVNGFFSTILSVPCVLARFPPGGHGRSMRHAKARIQGHQKLGRRSGGEIRSMPGSFPALPSPPDSDSEQKTGRILLSNESPILLVNTASLDVLNHIIVAKGGNPVPPAAFRGNIVIGPSAGSGGASDDLAYTEDNWSSLRIGVQQFQLMGSCRRCQMVCVDQETGEKREEPFVTLAKTRRFDGKVFFGTHMRHKAQSGAQTKETQFPTIRIGDAVHIDA